MLDQVLLPISNRSHFSTLSTSHKFPPVLLANGSYPPISGLDLQTQRTIGGGHERGGLYFLNTSPPIAICALSALVSPLQWHCRLGHPFFLTLKKVLPIKSPRLECESCELGKHHRASFPLELTNGYSRAPKGYRCYDPQYRWFFTSADVTLFESTPYYSPNSSPAIPHTSVPLPVPTLTIPPHKEPPTRPLQVYSRCNRSTNTTLTVPPGLPPTATPGNPSATPANDLPIALRKGHSVFVQTMKLGMVALAVYIDDISITGSDIVGIEEEKTYLQKHFITKDLGRPRYFLGIEIAHSKHGVSLSQRKYDCDLLQEAGLLGTKSVDTPMDSNPDFLNDHGNYLEDKTKYGRLVGKLIYLTVTRHNISFVIGLVSQFMDKPRSIHWETALKILKYIKASHGKGLLFKRHGHVKIEAYSDADYVGSKDDMKFTSEYCTYVGGNLVTWRIKKQTTVARSTAEA
ncbi:UNVERIFIED_CONTAM: Secreted RxLR effector protein [Sesamum calycinum]|uniref:Secreted RxLR effector protein n=1 Tax=Sesamum calycinum TaxID=2727403 RepID=A0AAW2LVS2_9LAMI